MTKRCSVKLLKFAFNSQFVSQTCVSRHFLSSSRSLVTSCQNNSVTSSTKITKITNQEALIQVLRNLSTSDTASEKSKSYDRNYITEFRAINEYLLDKVDLTGLRMTVRRSANEFDPPHRVYWRKDVEARAVLKWGSLEKVQLEKEVRESSLDEAHFPVYKKYLMEKYRERQRRRDEKLSRENWPVRRLRWR